MSKAQMHPKNSAHRLVGETQADQQIVQFGETAMEMCRKAIVNIKAH